LLLYVFAIICHVVEISHHLPPPQRHRIKQTLPTTPELERMMAQMMLMQTTMPQMIPWMKMQTTPLQHRQQQQRSCRQCHQNADIGRQHRQQRRDANDG
jgi:hypothetical protein